MDLENFLYGLLFILIGVTILVYQSRDGQFDSRAKVSQGFVRPFSGALIAIFSGLYFHIKAF
jgi:hypothetical protein